MQRSPSPAPADAPAERTNCTLSIEPSPVSADPYTDDGLRAMVQSGQVAASTQAWRPGAAGWAAIETYPELGGGSSTMPPPPPPPSSK